MMIALSRSPLQQVPSTPVLSQHHHQQQQQQQQYSLRASSLSPRDAVVPDHPQQQLCLELSPFSLMLMPKIDSRPKTPCRRVKNRKFTLNATTTPMVKFSPKSDQVVPEAATTDVKSRRGTKSLDKEKRLDVADVDILEFIDNLCPIESDILLLLCRNS